LRPRLFRGKRGVNSLVTEICVLGDGPAGASMALRLARLGHNVFLLGGGVPPRSRLLHSISPGICPFLDLLDLHESLDTFAIRCDPPEVRWETSEALETSNSSLSFYLVDRSRMHDCMREIARRAGVRVITARITSTPIRLAAGGWRIPLSADVEIQAGFLVVATGRKSLLSTGRRRIMPPLMALHSRWKVTASVRPRIYIEALPNGWVWGACVPDGICCAAVFMDPLLRSRNGRADIEKSYLAFLSEAPVFSDFLSGSRIDPVNACDASALLANEVIGSDWMLVGDSAVALEPISGQGIQVALKLGSQGAVAAHTLISDPSSAPVAEMFYRNQCRTIAARHGHATREFYAGPKRFQYEPFWIRRSAHKTSIALRPVSARRAEPRALIDANTPLRLSADATLREVPCLVGDRICLQLALDHPNLDGPASHLGNVSIAALLNGIIEVQTAAELCRSWMLTGLAERPLILLQWFIENGILVPGDERKLKC
jgi:flavin-dependent dehydrogenase